MRIQGKNAVDGGDSGIGARELWILLRRPLEEIQRATQRGFATLLEEMPPPEIEIVRDVVRGAALRLRAARDRDRSHLRAERARDGARDFVLDREHVLQRPLEHVGPHHETIVGVRHAGGHSQPIAVSLHRALENSADVQRFANFSRRRELLAGRRRNRA